MGVLQIGRGVALEGEHPAPVEDVVLDAVAGEIGVLDRADAHGAGDLLAGGRVELGVLLGDHLARALHRLVEQIEEAHRLAAAGLEHLLVGAQHRAEGDVLGPGRRREPARELGHLEDHREVLALRRADDVDEAAGAERGGAVAHGGEVGGAVAVAAVLLADDERERLALAAGEAGGEDAEGAVALAGQALGGELGGDLVEEGIVEALPGDVGVGERQAELGVHGGEVAPRLGDEAPPQHQGGLVAALEQHHAPPGAIGEEGVLVELAARRLVEGVDVAVGVGALAVPGIDEVLEEHAEGRAPVPQVVLADDAVPDGLEHAGERVAEDRAAQVADVHLLGDVRRRVVDDHRLRRGGAVDAQGRIGCHLAHGAREEAALQGDVDVARPGHLDPLGDAAEVEERRDLAGDVARGPAELLAQPERHVGLVVGAIRAAQRGVGAGVLGAEGGRDRGLERGRERVEGVCHGGSVPAVTRAVKANCR